MQDYITIGSTPSGEDCAQVGTWDYMRKSRRECRAFINQIIREHGEPPEGASLRIKSFSHDFGTYHEVAVYYDDSNTAACDYAIGVEGNTAEYWDSEALLELGDGATSAWPCPAN